MERLRVMYTSSVADINTDKRMEAEIEIEIGIGMGIDSDSETETEMDMSNVEIEIERWTCIHIECLHEYMSCV